MVCPLKVAILLDAAELGDHLVKGVDDLNRCYECGVNLVNTVGYDDDDGKPWCQEHGPYGMGETV